ARSWQEVLEPFVGDRWRLAELTVNYRTPAEIMAVAAEALRKVDPALQPPRSVRETGVPPWEETIAGDRLVGRLSELVDRELAAGVGAARGAGARPGGRRGDRAGAGGARRGGPARARRPVRGADQGYSAARSDPRRTAARRRRLTAGDWMVCQP